MLLSPFLHALSSGAIEDPTFQAASTLKPECSIKSAASLVHKVLEEKESEESKERNGFLPRFYIFFTEH